MGLPILYLPFIPSSHLPVTSISSGGGEREGTRQKEKLDSSVNILCKTQTMVPSYLV